MVLNSQWSEISILWKLINIVRRRRGCIVCIVMNRDVEVLYFRVPNLDLIAWYILWVIILLLLFWTMLVYR